MEQLPKISIKPPPSSANICSYSPISIEPPSMKNKILGPRQYLSFYEDGCAFKNEYNKTSVNINQTFIAFLSCQL